MSTNGYRYSVLYVKCVSVCMCISHRGAGPLTDRWGTLSDVQRCVLILLLSAAALLAPFVPLAAHRVDHAPYHTHLDRRTVHIVNTWMDSVRDGPRT